MDDEARATGLGPVPDREPERAPAGPAVAVSASAPRWARRSARRAGRAGPVRPDLCGARSRHQQLPAAGGARRPATASASSTRSRASSGWAKASPAPAGSERSGDGARGRGAAVCRAKMRNRGVTRARLIATEACRAAENGAEFLERVRDEVGLELEIVDRETEARLAATGCTPLVDPAAEGVILFDIGGGSSELVRLGRCAPTRHGPPHPAIGAWTSLPVGVVTLAERYGGVTVDRECSRPWSPRSPAMSAASPARALAGARRAAASARHLRHGDDHRRRPSRPAALRPPPRRRLLDERRRRSTGVVERPAAR